MCGCCWEPRDLVLHNYYRHLVSWFDLSRDFTDSWLNYFVFSPSCQNVDQLTPNCSMAAQGCGNVIQRWYRGDTEVIQRWYRGDTEVIQRWNQIVNCQDANYIPSETYSSAEMPFCRLPLVFFLSAHFSSIPSTNFFRPHFQQTFSSALFNGGGEGSFFYKSSNQ